MSSRTDREGGTRLGRRAVLAMGVQGMMAGWTLAGEKVDADVLLRGGTLYDGSGAEGRVGDVAIRGDRIVAVGRFDAGRVEQAIDCTGLIVAPGFIDLHTHCDRTLVKEPLRANLNYLTQGCSTVITGNCGCGNGDVAGYFEQLARDGVGTNVIHLLPYGPVRGTAMQNAPRHPKPDELQRLKDETDVAMKAGAWGMSTGLWYAWNTHADTAEVIEVARVVASRGGLYASHIRNEADGLVEAVEEALEIGREAMLPVHVSHFKSGVKQNWGKLRHAADRIEQARRNGQQATADQYPSPASSTSFEPSVVPLGAIPGGAKDLRERMKADPSLERQVRELLAARLGMTNDVMLCSCKKAEWRCRRISEIAEQQKLDPVDVALEVYCSGGATVINFSMSEDDVRYGMTLPWVATASDGWGAGPSNQPTYHPRLFGTFPRKIGRYTLEQNVLPLAQAIRSCTGLPSDILRLPERGYLREGAFADVVVVDPKTFRDQATFEKPGVYATGLCHLFVNGQPAIAAGKPAATLYGRVLRHGTA